MNINKQDKQTKHKPTPAALFVRQHWFAHLTLAAERSQAGEEIYI